MVSSPDREVSKAAGFLGTDNTTWYPKFYGYGVKVVSNGQVLYSVYSNDGVQKEIERFLALKPASK